MPRSHDMEKLSAAVMRVDAMLDHDCQYSDDEKTTIHCVTKHHEPKKSALKDDEFNSADTRPNRRLRFTAYDEGVTCSDVRTECMADDPQLTRSLFFYVAVVEIPHINDLSPKEVESVWMNDEEFYLIRQECLGTVGEIGDEKVTDGFLLRGLDQHTHQYTEAKDSIGRQVYDAVFSVQDFAKSNGIDCSELMAKLSQKYSEPSVVAAQSAALSDIFSSFKGTWTHRTIPTIPDGIRHSAT